MTNALKIENLSKIYANGVEALKNINLTVKKGDFFALLGVNGAGKSTTIGLITTLLKKTAGTIIINGYNLDTHPTLAKSSIGLVPQEFNLNIFETPEQILLTQAGYYGISRRQVRKRAEELLRQLGLFEKRKAYVRHLSGGMKRRLMIARGLIHSPKVLILDEPTAGIDIEIRRSVWEFLRKINEEGTTIILTTHYLEEAEQLCNKVAIIDKGQIITNTSMRELLSNVKHQSYVITTQKPFLTLPSMPFDIVPLDNTTFEIRLSHNVTLNDLFDVLNKNALPVHSLRNKTNRLEELFLDLINHGH